LIYVMRCIFYASRKVIKEYKGPFWKVIKFAIGECRSELNLVLILIL